eukprot:10421439-Alexandrium_andersonii.AAC.1
MFPGVRCHRGNERTQAPASTIPMHSDACRITGPSVMSTQPRPPAISSLPAPGIRGPRRGR